MHIVILGEMKRAYSSNLQSSVHTQGGKGTKCWGGGGG